MLTLLFTSIAGALAYGIGWKEAIDSYPPSQVTHWRLSIWYGQKGVDGFAIVKFDGLPYYRSIVGAHFHSSYQMAAQK